MKLYIPMSTHLSDIQDFNKDNILNVMSASESIILSVQDYMHNKSWIDMIVKKCEIKLLRRDLKFIEFGGNKETLYDFCFYMTLKFKIEIG